MKTNTILKLNQSFTLSHGFKSGEIAIFSNNTNDFVKLSSTKKSKKLAKVKRLFKHNLNCNNTFCFSHMTQEQIKQLIQIFK